VSAEERKEMYYYMLQTRIMDGNDAAELAKETLGAWFVRDMGYTQCFKGRAFVLQEAGKLTKEILKGYPFHLTSGGGYGVSVYDSARKKIGVAYATYPRCPGTDAYRGMLLWTRAPGMDDPYEVPFPRVPWVPLDCAVFQATVAREGDPYPAHVHTASDQTLYVDELNAINARFVTK
jgi:hypothetical protein